jgi:hypothetical protein
MGGGAWGDEEGHVRAPQGVGSRCGRWWGEVGWLGFHTALLRHVSLYAGRRSVQHVRNGSAW